MFEHFKVPDLLPAAPELFIAGMAMVILVADLFTKDKRRLLAFVLAELTLLGCLVLQLEVAGGAEPLTFSGMFANDEMSGLLKTVLYPTVMVVLFYARDYVADRDPMAKGEFYVLALFATLGMMVMISANHFLTIYVGLELLSLSLYAMVAMNRDSLASTEAAMKYFILGALASGLLLYGMSLIYGGIGSLNITTIFHQFESGKDVAGNPLNMTLLVLGLVFVVAGISFKLGVVPFHMWIPDVYQGAPTAVTLFIASAPKLAGFAIAMRLLPNGLVHLAKDWQGMLMILAVASMAIGNLAAIAQTNLKRMLAYSAISHMGFMLLGLTTGVEVTSEGVRHYNLAVDAYASAMFYVVAYVIMSLASFGMILLLARSGFESDRIEDLKGLNKRSPWFAGMMLMVMFSMAGIPFFVGFFAKFAVLQSAIRAGYMGLAIAAIIFSLIGAFYYLRVVKVMYFDPPSDDTALAAPLDMRLMLSINALAIAGFGLFPHYLTGWCNYAIQKSLTVLAPF